MTVSLENPDSHLTLRSPTRHLRERDLALQQRRGAGPVPLACGGHVSPTSVNPEEESKSRIVCVGAVTLYIRTRGPLGKNLQALLFLLLERVKTYQKCYKTY